MTNLLAVIRSSSVAKGGGEFDTSFMRIEGVTAGRGVVVDGGKVVA